MHTTLPRVPCSVRVCRAVKTSSNYLLMVFIPRSHPESQSAGLLLVNVPHSDRWLAELFPPRIQFVTLSECCKGIHINSEEDQTIIIRSHSYKTSSHRALPLPCQHQNTIDKGQLYRVFHIDGPKVFAYCSLNMVFSDFLSLLEAHQMWSIWWYMSLKALWTILRPLHDVSLNKWNFANFDLHALWSPLDLIWDKNRVRFIKFRKFAFQQAQKHPNLVYKWLR